MQNVKKILRILINLIRFLSKESEAPQGRVKDVTKPSDIAGACGRHLRGGQSPHQEDLRAPRGRPDRQPGRRGRGDVPTEPGAGGPHQQAEGAGSGER